MNLCEAALAPHVSAWLRCCGYEVFCEVPLGYGASSVDLVGRRGESLRCVEMKLSFTKQLWYQARRLQMVTTDAWAAVASMPSSDSIDSARRQGIGILRVAGGQLTELLQPSVTPDVTHGTWYRQKMLERLGHMTAGHREAGLPCLKGQGPAKRVQAAVREYLRQHPEAGWKEIFAAVPNHYVSYRSMAGAMPDLAELREAVNA